MIFFGLGCAVTLIIMLDRRFRRIEYRFDRLENPPALPDYLLKRLDPGERF